MQLALPGAPHLTYCSNIHAGESWPEVAAALAEHLPRIKARVAPDRPMGVGLRLSARAAEELSAPDARARFKAFLDAEGLYVFTVNAFPYGAFHGQRVKEQVYLPDWRTDERLRYTTRVADILADLVPAGLEASISTVPGAFKAAIDGERDVERIADGLVRAAAHLHDIERTRGCAIVLALEPEPACLLETTDEAIAFFMEHLFAPRARARFAALTGVPEGEADAALRRHLGLCFDVCHSAVAFEEMAPSLDAVQAAGIRVAKLQLSAALRLPSMGPDAEAVLAPFDDGIYLHQTVEARNGALTRHVDLPDAFAALRRGQAGGEWRVHCHVPVFLESFGDLSSTQDDLRQVLALCRERPVSPHLEVETYTWSVLPPALRNADLGSDIARELAWVRAELGA